MAGPWEKYQSAPAAGPWTKYAPPVSKAGAQPAQRTGLDHAADLAGVFVRHPFSAGVGLAENALGSITGGFGSLAEVVTGRDPGTFDTAYRPRSQAGQEIAALGAEEMSRIGQQYDRAFGTGPLATTLKERVPQAAGAIGVITTPVALRGVAGAKVPPNVGPRSTAGLRDPVPGEAPTAPPGAAAPAKRNAGLADVPEKAPTKEALKEASTAAYKRARESGVVVKRESLGALKERLTAQMRDEGIDPDLTPDANAALNRIVRSEGELTLQELENLRRVAKNAESSIRPADQRLAGKLVDELDDYIDGLTDADIVAGDAAKTAALKEARGLWSRARKADAIDELMRRAELSAQQFSGSGLENAIRTEFRALAKNERKMRTFTAEERAAIERVAKGGPLENALRMLGKFAPTGVVSTVLSSLGGAYVAGPAGLALPAAGAAARYGATRMTLRNARQVNELVRRGPVTNALTGTKNENSLRRPPSFIPGDQVER